MPNLGWIIAIDRALGHKLLFPSASLLIYLDIEVEIVESIDLLCYDCHQVVLITFVRGGDVGGELFD